PTSSRTARTFKPQLLTIALILVSLARATHADEPQPKLGELPWTNKPSAGAKLASQVTDAKQLLVNVAPSEYDSFVDGDPLPPDHGTLAKILYRLPRFLPSEIKRLARTDVDWNELQANPGEHRVEVVRLEGMVQSVEVFEMPREMAELFEFDKQYLVTMLLPESPGPVIVHALKVPDAWLAAAGELNQHAVAEALFLQVGRDGEGPAFHFAANRIAWLPEQASDAMKIGPTEVLLAEHGVDVGLMETVRERNRKPLDGADYESFYQMLAAARSIATGASDIAAQPMPLVQVLEHPQQFQGQWMSVHGRARRITKIVVESADIRERFKIDHYWQIDSLAPVGKTVIQFKTPKPGEEAPTYADAFPMTLCVLELPPELEAARLKAEQSGPDATLNEPIQFEGFFYKLWVYRSRYTTQFDDRLMQPSPMFVAFSPAIASPAESNPWIGLAAGGGFLIALSIVWIAVWRMGRRDDAMEKRMTERRQPNDGGSLNDLDLDVKSGPDFSHLDK
ncbi:MAG: hypothetical protein KDA47_22340, partial [Planctomycetales bacterium]|nr:hypothetical protein [Planctomycetales bacterium]